MYSMKDLVKIMIDFLKTDAKNFTTAAGKLNVDPKAVQLFLATAAAEKLVVSRLRRLQRNSVK